MEAVRKDGQSIEAELLSIRNTLMTKDQTTYPKLSEGTLTPAYGRDYKTKAEVIKDFRAGKDFKYNDRAVSIYCSIRDGVIGEMIKLRYNKRKEVLFYTITATDFMTEGK